MRRFILFTVAALLLLLAGGAQAHAQLNRLHFKGYRITRLMPTSTRSVTGTMEIECVNDTLSFTMSNISGTVYKDGEPFMRGDISPIKVPHGSSKVVVDCHYAALADGVGIMDLLRCLSFRPEDYTVDVSTTVIDQKGRRKNVAKQGVSVASLMRPAGK